MMHSELRGQSSFLSVSTTNRVHSKKWKNTRVFLIFFIDSFCLRFYSPKEPNMSRKYDGSLFFEEVIVGTT